MTVAQTRPRGRKSDVFSAGAALFAERGYAAVSVDEIGERAGITGSGIYNHFDGKESLLAAVIVGVAEQLARAAENATSPPSADAKEDLRRFAEAIFAATIDLADAAQVYLREMPRLRESDKRVVRRADERLLHVARRLVAEVSPGVTERSFRLRNAVVSGVMIAIARDKTLLSRRALHKVIADAALTVYQLPAPAADGAGRVATAEPRPWLPPPTRRDEILATATQLFAERAFHDVSMEDIGAKVGVTAAAIYRHFASKADIVSEAYVRVGSRTVVGMEQALRTATSADGALDALVRAYAIAALDASDLFVVAAQTVTELGPEDTGRVRRTQRHLLDTWTHVIRTARPQISEPHARALATAGIAAITQAAMIPRSEAPPLAELEAIALALVRA
jgi:AcrR family transcriptional regulator